MGHRLHVAQGVREDDGSDGGCREGVDAVYFGGVEGADGRHRQGVVGVDVVDELGEEGDGDAAGLRRAKEALETRLFQLVPFDSFDRPSP